MAIINGSSDNDNLQGTNDDDVIFSGGVSSHYNNINKNYEYINGNGGSDTLVLNADDSFLEGSGGNGHAQLVIRDFIVGDINTNDQADKIDIGGYLRGSNLNANNIGDYVFVVSGNLDGRVNGDEAGTFVFINKEGNFTDSDRENLLGDFYSESYGYGHGADLLLEIKGSEVNNNFSDLTGEPDNTVEQFQKLIDLGFLDLSKANSEPVSTDEVFELVALNEGEDVFGSNSNEVIYSGGLSGNWQSIESGGGSDRLVLDADDLHTENDASSTNARVIVRDFRLGDTQENDQADIFDIGGFLTGENLTAESIGSYLHVVSGAFGSSTVVYISKEGNFSVEDRVLLDGISDWDTESLELQDALRSGEISNHADLMVEFQNWAHRLEGLNDYNHMDFNKVTGYEDNTVEQYQALIDLGFLDLSSSNTENDVISDVNVVIGTSLGDGLSEDSGLMGREGVDDDIYSGGLGNGEIENVQGVDIDAIQVNSQDVRGSSESNVNNTGNDRLIIDGDDAFADNASNGNGHIRVRGFTIDDVESNANADTLVIGDLLRHDDNAAGFLGTAEDATRFLHFEHGSSSAITYLYIDRDGGFVDAASRTLSGGEKSAIGAEANYLIEFRTLTNSDDFDFTPNANVLNSTAHLQSLIDLGFLDVGINSPEEIPINGSAEADSIEGTAANEIIFSGGVSAGVESIWSNGGSDTLVLDGDDAHAENNANDSNGHYRIRDFTIDDVGLNDQADVLDIGSFLLGSNLDASNIGNYLHVVSGIYGESRSGIFVDKEGHFTDQDRVNLTNNVFDGGNGADLFLEFQGYAANNNLEAITGYADNTVEQFQSLIDLGFLDISKANSEAVPRPDENTNDNFEILGTAEGDGSGLGTGLIGEANRNDDFYSGGLSSGIENIQGVSGSQPRRTFEGSGHDRLILDADDAVVSQADGVGAAAGNGEIRLRGFTIDDTSTDSDADTIVLGDLLRGNFVDANNDGLDDASGLTQFDGTAEDAVRFLHFEEGGVQKEVIYIDVKGELGASDDSARALISDDSSYGGIVGGSSLMLRFYTFDPETFATQIDFNASGDELNTAEQVQSLVNLGFLDFSAGENNDDSQFHNPIIIQGTESADNLLGSSEDDIFLSGGLSQGVESIKGNGGSDTLVLDASDAVAEDIANNSNAHFRIRDFIIDDVTTNNEADVLDISDLLGGFGITADNLGNHLHIVSGTFGHNRSSIFIDRDGEFNDEERAALTADASSGGQGADLFLEFQGHAGNNNFAELTGYADNTAEQLQSLIDIGFLDVSSANEPAFSGITIGIDPKVSPPDFDPIVGPILPPDFDPIAGPILPPDFDPIFGPIPPSDFDPIFGPIPPSDFDPIAGPILPPSLNPILPPFFAIEPVIIDPIMIDTIPVIEFG